ncbi:hypothetical protein CHUAL_007643 [Chamberlinius hualienensis]
MYGQPEPDYSSVIGLLRHMNSEELRKFLSEEECLDRLIRDLPQVKNGSSERELALMRNRSLAEYNLSKEPQFRQAKQRLVETYERAVHVFNMAESNKHHLEELTRKNSLDTTLALLQTAAAQSEEESENVAEKFLDGSLNVEEFLDEFHTKRKFYHLRRIKSEKMADLLSGPPAVNWNPRHSVCGVPSRNSIIGLQTESGHLIINQQAMKEMVSPFKKGKKKPKFWCEKRAIYRNQVEANDKRNYRVARKFVKWTNSTPMDIEYAHVQCMVDYVCVYNNYFFNIVRKPAVEKRCKINSSSFLANKPSCVEQERLSVLVMGIDSVSRTNLLRQLPNIYSLLINKLQAIDMYGYNKVGRNTYPSLIPYLTGNSSDEIMASCLKNWKNSFDNCTFAWDLFENAGYRTAFVENLDYFGLFLLNKGGSRRQLAHYYGHTLYLPVKQYNILKNGCWRGESDDSQVLKWAYLFQREFANDPHFGHFWISRYSHDSVVKVQFLETSLMRTFENMIAEGLLNKTLLIFMSDHGMRFGKFRQTEIGRQEENLPFMYFIFPQWFREKFQTAVDIVRQNRHRLITTFDLHETLKDILNCDYATVERMKFQPEIRRGISLFKPISANRTCDDAGIPSVYCACKAPMIDLTNNSYEAKRLATLLVKQINNFTENVRDICAKFVLRNIISFKKYLFQSIASTQFSSSIIRNSHVIAITVEPGKAQFEATIQYDTQTSSYIVNKDIRRVNKYGNTSYCITYDDYLRSICYCGLPSQS